MSQEKELIDIDLNFEYKPGVSFYDAVEEFQETILDYKLFFESMDWTKEELDYIAKQLVETGKIFAMNQGFGRGGTSLLHFSKNVNKFGTTTGTNVDTIIGAGATGNLLRSIKAQVHGTSIDFFNDATNSRGQAYAGHLEYGFHARDGKFIPARPFMRPAMHAVAAGSRGEFRQIMKGLLDNLWTSRGYNGLNSLVFGRKSGSQSLFWKQNGSFGSKLSQRTRMPELKGQSHRKQMSANRKLAQTTKTGRGYKGYRFSKNRKDFRGLSHAGKKSLREQEKNTRSQKPSSKKQEKNTGSQKQPLSKEKRSFNNGRQYKVTKRGLFSDSQETFYKYNGVTYSNRRAAFRSLRDMSKSEINKIEEIKVTTRSYDRTTYTGRFGYKKGK